MRIVGMHHVGPRLARESGQAERRQRRPVAAERKTVHVDSRGPRALLQDPARATGQRHLMATCRHSVRAQQHLVLPAPPPGRRVHVEDLEGGDGETRFAQQESAAEDVVADEGPQRCHAAVEGAGALPLSMGLLRPQRRVAVDGAHVIGDVVVGVVLEVVAQASHRPVDAHRLVDQAARPSPAAPVEQAELRIGIPVGAADPPSEVEGDARDAVAGVGEARRAQRFDLRAQPCRHPLVRIHGQHPVVPRRGHRVVALGGEPIPGPHFDAGAGRGRDLARAIGGARVEDQHVVAEPHALQRGGEPRLLVQSDQHGRDRGQGKQYRVKL
jgi:hypothetical protein